MSRLGALVPALFLLGAALRSGEEPQGEPRAAGAAITGAARYHEDPEHPWNRLHRALARRELRDGEVVGLDEADVLLWPDSHHLLEPARKAELLAALESVAQHEPLDDPLKAVLLQQDLWALFDWAVAEHRHPLEDGFCDGAGARELGDAAVLTLARTAPSSEQLARLPDTLAATARASELPREADPAAPQRPFLPADLAEPGAGWLLLGDLDAPGELLGIQHAHAFGGRSLFEVHARAPGGREATLRWLAALREHPAPRVACGNPRCFLLEPQGALEAHGAHHHLALDLPPPPPGTTVALVRRALAFDRDGELHATPLAKSVQLRTFLEPPEGAPVPRMTAPPQGWPWQAVAELVLDPERLLASRGAPLAAVQPGQATFDLFGSHGDGIAWARNSLPRGARLDGCIGCHGAAGTASLVSYVRFATGPTTHFDVPVAEPPRRLAPVDPGSNVRAALDFKGERADWRALRERLRGR